MDALLDQYGLAAAVALTAVKAAGVPIPIPGDLVVLATAARAADGKLALGPAYVALLLALLLGGSAQFALVRGPGRGVIDHFGRFVGLTPARLEAAAGVARRGGLTAVSLAIFTPGLRAVVVAACGLAALPLRTFLPGLAVGNAANLALHFAIGYLGWPVVAGLAQGLSPTLAIGAALAILASGLGVWILVRRRQRPDASPGEVAADALASWHEATCPACLAVGALRGLGAIRGEAQHTGAATTPPTA